MLEAAPKHLCSNTYIVREDGDEVCRLALGIWRERARFTHGDQPYRLSRKGGRNGPFILERDHAVLASATKTSHLADRYEIELDGRTLVLQRERASHRRFLLQEGERRLGAIRPRKADARRPIVVIELPADWPLESRLFILWLTLLLWNREESIT